MNKKVKINIDRKSWPKPPKLPALPSSFIGVREVAMNFPAILLRIGYLTTPSSSSGISLSEYWAWVRYLVAITDDDDLRLSSAFSDLDAHQKTILSDDFGMGVPMHWLSSALDLREICDGRYFLERYGAIANVEVRRTAKRGPNKTPDFISRDANGVWHIVECKGTQSGNEYRDQQIGESGPIPTGGIAQKGAVRFPKKYTGQRLVCALSIAAEGDAHSTNLKIVDPDLEDPIKIKKRNMKLAEDAVQRSTVAKALRLAGFDATAELTAAPWGPSPQSKPDSRARFEQLRKSIVERKTAAAMEELSDSSAYRKLFDGDGQYRGREVSIDLPKPISVNGQFKGSVVVRQAVNSDVISELKSNPLVESPLPESNVEWQKSVDQTNMDFDGDYARFSIGDLYMSEIILK